MASHHKHSSLASEWSHRIDGAIITNEPQRFYLSADEAACKALSRRLGVKEIESLEGTLNISLVSGCIYVGGHLKAKVIQECVVSMDLIEDYIEDQFEAWFVDKDQTVSFNEAKKNRESQKGHVEVEISDESDDPEPLVDGNIEAGDLVAQYLSLAINPYPHKDGVAHEVGDDNFDEKDASPARKSPFEALKDWKNKQD